MRFWTLSLAMMLSMATSVGAQGRSQSVIDGRILVRQLVAEINDATSPRNRSENGWRDPGKRRHSLANDNELPLDGGANSLGIPEDRDPESRFGLRRRIQRYRRDRPAGHAA